MNLPVMVQPSWRGHTDESGAWISEWPPFLCKECGIPFEGVATRRYCSELCKKRAKNRSDNHAGRTRTRSRKDGRIWPKYEIVGKFELLQAFQGLCGYCAKPVALNELIIGHIAGVLTGGQHTRKNISPVHPDCEADWNRVQRERPEVH